MSGVKYFVRSDNYFSADDTPGNLIVAEQPDDRVVLDVHQGRAPTLPQPGESGLEQSVEGSPDGSSPLSLEGRELKAKSSILRRHGRIKGTRASRPSRPCLMETF
jgi:hypothetical protein